MTILTGDCRDLMPAHGPFDLILANPPYGDTSLAWDRRVEGWITRAREALQSADDGAWDIDAPWLENILEGSDVSDYESLQYFQTQLGDSGILDELVAQGVEEEDTIKIGEYEFDYLY